MGKAADEAFQRARDRIAQAQREMGERLDLTAPGFEDLEKLPEEIGGLTALTKLFLSGTLVSDVSALSGLTALTALNLGGTQVSDVSGLSGLTALTWLNLAGSQVSDVSALSRLTALTTLDLWGTQVSDVSVLSGLTALIWLDLLGTRVSDVSALSGLTELTSLNLRFTKVSDVSALSGLTALTSLSLGGTQVSDVSGLSGLTALTWLNLAGSQVSDVSALSRLTALKFLDLGNTGVGRAQLAAVLRGKPGLVPPEARNALAGPCGVLFAGSAATQSNSELALIAGIEDDRERSLRLFEYLGVEAEGEEGEPEPDPLLPSLLEGGKLEIPASFPGPDELEERLKRVMHERLRPKAAEAAQKAGNEAPRMAGKARVLAALLDRPFEDLDLLAVHLEVEDIDARAKVGGEDGIPYDADLLAVVGDVTRLGPGLTRGNADVELFHERLLKTRETPVLAEVEAARARLSDAVLADPAAHGPRSLAMELRLMEVVDPDVARALREPKQRNLLWRLASVAALEASKDGRNLGVGIAGGLIANSYGPQITAFVMQNWALLLEVAATYGAGFALWISSTVGLLMIRKGVKLERDRRARKDRSDGAR